MRRTIGAILATLATVSAVSAAEITLGALKSNAPEAWKKQEAANKFRAYQFSLPRASGDEADAELVVFYFGEGSGGGVDENVKRWQSTFEAPEGKTIADVSKVEKIKLDKASLTYVDIAGTFLSKFPPFDPNAKVTRKANFRRLGVIFQCDGGPYFITVTGPSATVERHKADFDRWLKNFK